MLTSKHSNRSRGGALASAALSAAAVAAAVVAPPGSSADAAVLNATYDFTGYNGTGSHVVPSVPGVTFSQFGRTGTANDGSSNDFRSNGWPTGAAISLTDYVNFTVSPQAGYTLTVTSIQFAHNRENGTPSGQVRYSANAFADSGAAGNFSPGTASPKVFDPADSVGSTEFRVYMWNAQNANSYLLLDDVVVNGTITANNNDSQITGSPVPTTFNDGNYLVGATPASHAVTLNKTGVESTTYSVATTGGVTTTLASGAFGDFAQSANGNISFSTATSGDKSGSVTVDNLAATSNGAGLGSADADEVYQLIAAVYDPAAITPAPASGGTLNAGQAVGFSNAAGAFRANGQVTTLSVGQGLNGTWGLSGIALNDVIAAGSGANGTVTFNQAGLLNGATSTGSLSLAFTNHLAGGLNGATAGDAGSASYTLQHTVAGNVGNGTANVANGGAYDNLSATSPSGLDGASNPYLAGTVATLLDGNAGAARTVSMTWRARTPAETVVPPVLSDVVNLTGTGSDLFVLQISYDEADLGLVPEGELFLGWFDAGSSAWVNAVMGNSDLGAGASPVVGPYDGNLTLSRYGIDTTNNVVWAVLDHNSDFAVVVPEPGALGVLTLAAIAGMTRITRRQRRR